MRNSHKYMTEITRTTSFGDLPEYLSPEEVQAYLNLGRSTVYGLIGRGQLKSVRFGRCLRVPKEELKK